jgi:hypothetical protein
MAETQRSPESVSIRKTRGRLLDPPGLRRLRFPFFDSLVKERLGEAATTPGPACAAPFIVEARPFTRLTQESLALNPEIACPLPRTSTWRAKPPN